MSDELLQAMWDAFTKTGDNDFESMRAVLDVLHAHGYRRCAEGQRVTQWCDRAEEAEAEVERLKEDYRNACKTVAQLYAAATGRHGEGPLRGVIEDAAAVCSERDALRAEVEWLRAEVERLRADAERYRWLRGEQHDIVVGTNPGAMDSGMTVVIGTYDEWLSGDDMDAAIDAARGES